MAPLKIGSIVTLAVLGLSAAPAQAFGPMMLLMMPMMMSGHQHVGEADHKDSMAGHPDAPQAPVGSKPADPAGEGRSPSNPPTPPQHAESHETHRTDAEHGR